MRFDTVRTPPLSEPEHDSVARRGTGGSWGKRAFWPNVCERPFEFSITAYDWADNEVRFTAPVIFVEDCFDASCEPNGLIGRSGASSDCDPETLIGDVRAEYEAIENEARRYRDLFGQSVALAPSRTAGDTDCEGLSFALKADYVPLPAPNCGEVCELLPAELDRPPFEPEMHEVQLRVPALKRIAPGGDGSAWFAPDIITSEDPQEIFARQSRQGDSTLAARFHEASDSSGGLAAPTPQINALSRVFGPVGVPREGDPRFGHALFTPDGKPGFDTGSFFGDDARILGTLKVKDILSDVLPISQEGGTPGLTSRFTNFGDRPDFFATKIEWETRELKDWPSQNPVFVTDGNQTRLLIDGGFIQYVAPDFEATFFMRGGLENFSIQIVFSGNGFKIDILPLRLIARHNEKTEVSVDIGGIHFVGAALQFIQRLQQLLNFGGSNGLTIDVQPRGIVIKAPPLNSPALTVGAFSFENLLIYSQCVIPFR